MRNNRPVLLIPDLLVAIRRVQNYIAKGRSLTSIQVESLSLALSVLATSLGIWKTKSDFENRLSQNDVGHWFRNIVSDAIPNPIQGKRNPAAVVLGRLGGSKGGKLRAKKLSPQKRSAIARLAARARWDGNRRRNEVPSKRGS